MITLDPVRGSEFKAGGLNKKVCFIRHVSKVETQPVRTNDPNYLVIK